MPCASNFIERILRSAKRLDRLIQDVLAFSRVSRQEVKFERVDVEKLLSDLLQERPEFQLPAANISVQSPLPPVLGHEAFLTQCLSNLLGSAVKFVPRGVTPEIKIWAEEMGSTKPPSVRLWVEDNGTGLSEDAQRKLFLLFERHHDSTQYEGAGIALAIVRKAAQRMNGHVGVQSEPGKGSRFWLQVPRAS